MYSLQKYNCITGAVWETASVVITLSLKHLWGYITPWVGNLMQWKSCVLNEIDGMSILVPVVFWKYNLVTF
jgi:hypothetical protein